MMTNSLLQALYHQFNKQYFSNRLPKDMVAHYDAIWQMGVTKYYRERPLYILLSHKLRWTECGSGMVLLHEMCHVSLPYRVNHGKEFQKAMLKLARKGAFKDLW